MREVGEVMLSKGLSNSGQLEEALRLSHEWGSRLGDVILSTGWVRPVDFYTALADHFNLDFVDLVVHHVDPSLIEERKLFHYSRALLLPWKRVDGVLWVATADPGSAAILEITTNDPSVRVVVTSKFDIIWELQRVAEVLFSHRAVNQFPEQSPVHSARPLVT